VLAAGVIAGGGAMAAAIAVSAARGVSDHHGLSVQYITAPGLLRQFAGLFAALDLSTGIAPFAIFVAVIVASRRASTSSWMDGEVRSLAVVTASLSVGLAIFGSVYLAGIPPRWRPSPPPDRYVFYVLPLILTLFAAWIEGGAPITKPLRFAGLTAATLPVVVGAAEVRKHGFAATSNSLGYMPWMFVRFVTSGATWLVVLAGYCFAVAAALAIASHVHTRRLVRIVSASTVVSTAFAFGYVGLGSLNAARHSPPAGWLDARTDGRVIGVWLRPPTDRQAFALWETQATTRNLYRVYYVTEPDQLGPEAKLEQVSGRKLLDNGAPVNARYALTSSTTPIVGRLVAQRNGLALYKIRPPLRIAAD
jgi:hypothetical protein